jgi:hypothetical protein
MNWLARIFSMIGPILGIIETVHGDTLANDTKTQMAADSLTGLSAGLQASMPEQAADIGAATTAATAIIPAVHAAMVQANAATIANATATAVNATEQAMGTIDPSIAAKIAPEVAVTDVAAALAAQIAQA